MDEEDDTANILKRKKTKGEREEEERKLLRTIFVGNLSTTVKKKHLVREFSQFGTVETARLRSVALVDVSALLAVSAIPYLRITPSLHAGLVQDGFVFCLWLLWAGIRF